MDQNATQFEGPAGYFRYEIKYHIITLWYVRVDKSKISSTVKPSITDPPTSGQPTLAVAPNEITTELVFNQPPTSGHFLIPDSGQAAACSQLTNSVQQCLL